MVMTEKYYNRDKQVSKEEFDKERRLLLADRFRDVGDESKMIPIEELDYYLGELEKLWDK
jgi:hypothetical protein